MTDVSGDLGAVVNWNLCGIKNILGVALFCFCGCNVYRYFGERRLAWELVGESIKYRRPSWDRLTVYQFYLQPYWIEGLPYCVSKVMPLPIF